MLNTYRPVTAESDPGMEGRFTAGVAARTRPTKGYEGHRPKLLDMPEP
jgi:hypothetical protein